MSRCYEWILAGEAEREGLVADPCGLYAHKAAAFDHGHPHFGSCCRPAAEGCVETAGSARRYSALRRFAFHREYTLQAAKRFLS